MLPCSIAFLFLILISGGSPGPYVAGNAAYITTIPWGDVLHVQPAGPAMPAAMALALNAAGPGIVYVLTLFAIVTYFLQI